ncbi:MAG TPA: chromate transporter [Candidatus Saccharimonadales bacterium]|nr:chromate transporter [Candidatus Saccharimonadales bacterium]
MSLVELALLFVRVGAVSFGGGTSVLAELQRELVDQRAALSQQQFLTAYALGQATPGPGILFIIPLGFYAAGAPGAVVALVAFVTPPLLLQILVASQWERLSRSATIRALDRTLIPVSVGLIGASLYALGVPLLHDPRALVGGIVAAVIVVYIRPNPAVVVLAAGLLGIVGVI